MHCFTISSNFDYVAKLYSNKFNDHQIASDDEQLRQEIYDLCQAGKTFDAAYVWKGNIK